MEKKCEVEVFSRVTGFYRPVQSWNKGKASEFSDRKRFNFDEIGDISENENCRIKESISS